jgi:2-amino-4-hydroxy-6-hydroxymethyldihydropteridine diphosphokinase
VLELSYTGIGSNLGDPLENCRLAIRIVSEAKGISLVCRSSFYRSEPVGLEEQPWFVNAVIQVRTSLTPRDLLTLLLDIEGKLGRKRRLKWGPRIIDLDILLFGDLIISEEDLIIPHPRLHQRRFVLEPLCEIGPDSIHPGLGKPMTTLLNRIQDEKTVIKVKPEVA